LVTTELRILKIKSGRPRLGLMILSIFSPSSNRRPYSSIVLRHNKMGV